MNEHEAYNKENVFQEILRSLFYTAKGKRRRFEFDQDQEVRYILNYIDALLSSNATIEERSQILKQIKLFGLKEIKEEYVELIKSIEEKASHSQDLMDRLYLLLTDDYFYLRNNLESQLLDIISKYQTWKSFMIDFVNVKKKLSVRELHSFWNSLNVLIRHKKDGCKELFEYVYQNEKGLVHDFANLIQANHEDEKYFYEQVNRIWNFQDKASGRNTVWLLTHGRNDMHEKYRERDFIYFEKMLQNKDYEAIDRLIYTIWGYLYVNKEKTLKIISELFLMEEKFRHKEHLIFTLFDENKHVADDFKNELREIIFSSALDIDINNHFYQYILNFLDNYFGYDELLKYLIRRIDHLQSKNEYLAFYVHQTYQNNKLAPEIRDDYFINVIEWYLTLSDPKPLLHEKLVEFFRPSLEVTKELAQKMKAIVDKNSEHEELLQRIAESLYSFESINEERTLLCVYIAEKYLMIKGHNPKLLNDLFGSDLVYNTGSKSKSGFGAFPQDIAKRDLLKKVLSENKMSPPVVNVLENALEKVKADIESESSKGEMW
jgi:hypothetical protein